MKGWSLDQSSSGSLVAGTGRAKAVLNDIVVVRQLTCTFRAMRAKLSRLHNPVLRAMTSFVMC